MGRAVRLEGNPKLAKPHTKGATVTLTQDLNHAQYGGVAYQWFRLMIVELALAEQSRDHLRDQHSVVLAMPVDVSNIRTIDDLDFLADVYDAGSGMVSHVVRAVQHLAVEMQREGQPLLATTVADRLQEAARGLGINDCSDEPDYQGFVEIVRIRDAIEHPRDENLYQGDKNRWDEVPLAWMLSERGLQAYERFERWITRVADDWNAYLQAHPRTITFDVVKRGVESLLPAKKSLRQVEGGAGASS